MKTLIERNTKAINANMADANKVKPLLQGAYDECKAIGARFEAAAFIEFVRTYHANQAPMREKVIEQYVKNQLFSQMEVPNFGGVPIDKNKLKELISMPIRTA